MADLIVGAVVAVILGSVIYKMFFKGKGKGKDNKDGGCGCGCGCH